MKKNVLLSFIILNTFHPVQAQQYNKISDRLKNSIDSAYNALIEKHKVVGLSLAIVDYGEIVYSAGYGYSDQEQKIPATDKTVFRIGSCTKSFTSLSLMQLQERGKLKIDQSVKEYIPELKITSRFNDNNPILIRDMMCHVSGLPTNIMNGFYCDSPPGIDQLIENLNKNLTIWPRRYKQAYSNAAYGLLGEVVARKSNTTYDNYIKENIFEPLQMSSSFIYPPDVNSADLSKAYAGDKEIREPVLREMSAGGIQSSAADMGRYVQMYLNNGVCNGTRIISETSCQEMKDNHMKDVLLSSRENWGYGLFSGKALVITGNDSITMDVTGHSGGTFAFCTAFKFIPGLDIGVVVLTNTDNGRFIWNDNTLLELYLWESRSKKIKFNYLDPESVGGVLAGSTDIKGFYNTGEMAMTVKDPKKIAVNKHGEKMVLERDAAGLYTARKIQSKSKNMEVLKEKYAFVKLDTSIYLKRIFDASSITGRREEYIARNVLPMPIPRSWQKKYGNYEVTGKVYKCTDCIDLNFEGMTLKLSEQDGFIEMKTSCSNVNMNEAYYLDVVSDKIAVVGGLGEGSGQTVRILDNGNIYYNGFEFVKVK